MEYREAIDWLYERQLFGIKLGLEGPLALLAGVGNPQHRLRFIHVAGTNGKGSTCAFAAGILRAHGIRTGLFTSPHLVDFRERIVLDGAQISESDCARILTELRCQCERMAIPPTFFEISVALALIWFAERRAEAVVLETGMGGRLDATNCVCPEVCAITPIGLDHRQWLGDSLGAIASEKAGILKPGIPAVFAPQEPAALEVLTDTARRVGAPFEEVRQPFEGNPLPLRGPHQRWNAAVAIAACRFFLRDAWNDEAALRGLGETEWPGRFQILAGGGGGVVLDGAHNEHAARTLLTTWGEEFPGQQALVVFGAMQDKEPATLLTILEPVAREFYFVRLQSPRSSSPEDLHSVAGRGRCFSTAGEALAAAMEQSNESGMPVLVTGSLFLLGEVLAALRGEAAPDVSSQ